MSRLCYLRDARGAVGRAQVVTRAEIRSLSPRRPNESLMFACLRISIKWHEQEEQREMPQRNPDLEMDNAEPSRRNEVACVLLIAAPLVTCSPLTSYVPRTNRTKSGSPKNSGEISKSPAN
jgi:hypothetical protein